MPALVNCPATTGPKSQAAPGLATLTFPEAGVAAEALLPASRRADRDEATDAARFIGNAPILECGKLGMIRCKSTGAMFILERLRAETRSQHLAIVGLWTAYGIYLEAPSKTERLRRGPRHPGRRSGPDRDLRRATAAPHYGRGVRRPLRPRRRDA